jgi:hypothetical protein
LDGYVEGKYGVVMATGSNQALTNMATFREDVTGNSWMHFYLYYSSSFTFG